MINVQFLLLLRSNAHLLWQEVERFHLGDTKTNTRGPAYAEIHQNTEQVIEEVQSGKLKGPIS